MRRPKISAVYAVLNVETGETYIGSSDNVLKRATEHLRGIRGGYHQTRKIKQAVLEYGVEAFTFVIVEECKPLIREERELFWLQAWSPEYNSSYESALGPKGYRHTPEAKAEISRRMFLSHAARKAL